MRSLLIYLECSVICFVLLWFCYIRARRYTGSIMFFFKNIVVKMVVLTAVDMLAHIAYELLCIGKLPHYLIGVDIFFILLYLLVFNYLVYSIFLKQTVLFFPQRMSSVFLFVLYSIPFWLSSALIMSSLFNDTVVMRNAMGLPSPGNLMWCLLVSFLFYVSCMMIDPVSSIIEQEKKSGAISNYMALILISTIIPVLCGIYDIANQTSFFTQGMTLVLFFIYLVLMKRNISTDYLTGLSNRSELGFYLDRCLSSREIQQHPCLMFLDINGFKTINDNFGHAEGDRAIRLISFVLSKVSRKRRCFLSRYGGDEFVLVIPKCDEVLAEKIKTEIQRVVRAVDRLAKVPYKLSVSVGYVMYNSSFTTAQAFLDEADRRMYLNKRRYYKEQEKMSAR
ncbi:MAG: GGDEF domain-containing protein [Succinivibrio sp.]|nr:GGDEF domain-containing protein [Succinivibrio sp.]